jgi:hypothetical protein
MAIKQKQVGRVAPGDPGQNQSFASRLSEAQAPIVPTSQTVAAGLGATSQEVAMTGTQAQVQSTIADRLEQAPMVDSTQAQQQQLRRIERLQPQQRDATVEETLEAEMQEKLAGLGNIGQSIKNTIESNIAAISEQAVGQIDINESYLANTLGVSGPLLEAAKQDQFSDYNKVKGILSEYYTKGDVSEEAALAALANFSDVIKNADAKKLIGLTTDLIAKNTGQTVAENIMDSVTIADLDLTELGFADINTLAETLEMNPEDLAELTTDQFTDLIEAKQQSEFSKVEGLKAQLVAAPLGSLQREILLKELRDLGHIGLTGVEAEFAETVEDINLGQFIKIGEERVKVSDFLADENLSKSVMDYINETDPVKKEEILSSEEFPELTTWINSNAQALATMSTTLDDTQEVFDKANEAYKASNIVKVNDTESVDLSDSVMKSALGDKWPPEKAITSAELQTIQSTFNASTIGQILNDKNIDSSTTKDLLAKFNNASVEQLDVLDNMSSSDIQIASGAAEELRDNSKAQQFLGLDGTKDFILDEDLQDKIMDYSEVLADIPTTWLANDAVVELMQDLSVAELQSMVDDERLFDDFKLLTDKRKELGNIKSEQDKIDFIFGSGHTLDGLNKEFAEVRKWASLGNKEAQDQLDIYRSIFGPANGISVNLLDSLISDMSSNLKVGASGVIGGKFNKAGLLNNKTKLEAKQPFVLSAEFAEFKDEIFDGLLKLSELTKLDPARQKALGEFADKHDIKVQLGEFSSYKDYAENESKESVLSSGDLSAETSGLTGLDEFYALDEAEIKRLITSANSPTYKSLITFQSDITNKLLGVEFDTAIKRELATNLLSDINAAIAEANKRISIVEARASGEPLAQFYFDESITGTPVGETPIIVERDALGREI